MQGTGREFIWDFEEQARRIRAVTPGLLPVSPERFEEIIGACREAGSPRSRGVVD
jgi:hypothetical protein